MADAAAINDGLKGTPSQWGGLSKHLIARLYPVDKNGKSIDESQSIFAPITDASVDVTLNWQSPFENSGPESKAPALMAMIQSGSLSPVLNALQDRLGLDKDSAIGKGLKSAEKASEGLEGRTGITKLNSRQIFSGMAPFKMQMTLHFRALSDPVEEVVKPLRQLLEWALPQSLAADGVLAEVIRDGTSAEKFISALFPSQSPQMIGFVYGNERYAPMVIEHISRPLDVQRAGNGDPIYMAVQVSIATLTALDKNDVKNIFLKR